MPKFKTENCMSSSDFRLKSSKKQLVAKALICTPWSFIHTHTNKTALDDITFEGRVTKFNSEQINTKHSFPP